MRSATGLRPRLVVLATPFAALAQHVRSIRCRLGIHNYKIVGIRFNLGSVPDETMLECHECHSEITRTR